MLIGLGQSGVILGIGSGVNSAQIHGLKVEFGCAQGNLEYEHWQNQQMSPTGTSDYYLSAFTHVVS